MLQRIQTIYLLLAAVLMALSVTNFSLLFFTNAELDFLALTGQGVWLKGEYLAHTWGILCLGLLSGLLSLVSVFLFKKRKKQILLCGINILVIVLFYVTVAVYVHSLQPELGLVFDSVQIGLILPLVALVLNVLAFSKIRADEKLVRSLDRIR